MPDSSQRLFFALLPDEVVREQLRRLQKDLSQAGGRAVPAENLHLTLLFLGDVPTEKIEAVRDTAADVAGCRFDLMLDTFGSFKQRNTRVLWLGPSEQPPELGTLHQSLCQKIGDIGLHVRNETYRPHVTLIRKADPRKRVPERPDRSISWTGRRCALIASELLPTGSRYRVLVERNLPSKAPGRC